YFHVTGVQTCALPISVHGGGFYNPQKYLVAPKTMPANLHWFYWEAYSTWLSGFALLAVLYLFNPSVFLVDKAVLDWPPAAAVARSEERRVGKKGRSHG